MFYLTPQERQAVMVLVTVFCVGSVVSFCLRHDWPSTRWVDHAHHLKININSADKLQLRHLPEVGETLADKIIAFRNINGPFSNIDDLRKIKGMTQRRLDRMKELIEL